MEKRKSVKIFSNLMENRLQEKDHENNGDSWKNNDCNIDRLRNALQKKVSLLHENCFDLRPDDVQESCIDIANYAMMIVDRIMDNRDRDAVDNDMIQPDKPWDRE